MATSYEVCDMRVPVLSRSKPLSGMATNPVPSLPMSIGGLASSVVRWGSAAVGLGSGG